MVVQKQLSDNDVKHATNRKVRVYSTPELQGFERAAWQQVRDMQLDWNFFAGQVSYVANDINEGEEIHNTIQVCETFVNYGKRHLALWGRVDSDKEVFSVDGAPIYHWNEKVLVSKERVGYRLARERNLGYVIRLMLEADFQDKAVNTLIWKDLTEAQRNSYRAEAADQIGRGVIPAEELPYHPLAVLIKKDIDCIEDEVKRRTQVEREANNLFGIKKAA